MKKSRTSYAPPGTAAARPMLNSFLDDADHGTAAESQDIPVTSRVFRVEGFGEVGYWNLAGFVPFDGFKLHGDLAIGEVSEGKLTTPGTDHKPERITRVS